MSSPDPSRTGATPRLVLALAAVVVLLAAVIGTPRPAGAAATPSSTLAGLGDRLIGEEFTFTATFDNTGTDTGYAPFIDLLFPRNGADGSAGADTPDGIEFIGVDYLGLPVRVDRLPVPDDDGAGPGTTGTVEHPLTGELITATAGDELVVLSAPFGSFAPGQPAADLAVTARLSSARRCRGPARHRAALRLRARGDAPGRPRHGPAAARRHRHRRHHLVDHRRGPDGAAARQGVPRPGAGDRHGTELPPPVPHHGRPPRRPDRPPTSTSSTRSPTSSPSSPWTRSRRPGPWSQRLPWA